MVIYWDLQAQRGKTKKEEIYFMKNKKKITL